jgi:eukaryotic-like serine/threonine-protein kinase
VSVEVGQVLGNRYRAERLVGPSATGMLYEGSDANTRRRVGISVLGPTTDGHRAGTNREHEARSASRIGNQHILEVFDVVGLLGGERCVITEWLPGETLEARLDRVGTISQTDIAPLMLQVLDGLGAAHRAGIVHRHLTPASVMIVGAPPGQQELVKVVGFGVRRSEAETEVPHYLAPEQLRSQRDADARSNVYAAGVIMYRAVTGQPPWPAENAADFARNVSLRDPTAVEELAPEISPELARIILKAMARTPQARYPSAQEMLEAMAQWARGNFLTEALVVLQAPESVPTRPLPRARPTAPPVPERPPPSQPTSSRPRPPSSSRPRPVVERNPVIVAPVHRPQKPRSEEAPVDLVVISETPLSATRPVAATRGAPTDPALLMVTGLRRGRKILAGLAVLVSLLGLGTVLTQLGLGPLARRTGGLGESRAASLGAMPPAPAPTPVASQPAVTTRPDEPKTAPEPSSTPQPLVEAAEQANVPEPSSARNVAPVATARPTTTPKPSSRSKSRPARETSSTTASPPARVDTSKPTFNPYGYR